VISVGDVPGGVVEIADDHEIEVAGVDAGIPPTR
jgi:hypothetical protein